MPLHAVTAVQFFNQSLVPLHAVTGSSWLTSPHCDAMCDPENGGSKAVRNVGNCQSTRRPNQKTSIVYKVDPMFVMLDVRDFEVLSLI